MDDDNVWFAAIILSFGVGFVSDNLGWGLVTFGAILLVVWLVQKQNS